MTKFKADCTTTPATLLIRVDNAFTAYLNGRAIGSGTKLSTTFSFKMNLACGLNRLMINVWNRKAEGAVIYKVVIDEDTCYKCNAAAFYNY